jgi:hypothetical protein
MTPLRVISQMNPVHILQPYFIKIHFNITHPCLSLSSDPLPSGYPTNMLYDFVISPMCVAYPVQFILLNFIILIIVGAK